MSYGDALKGWAALPGIFRRRAKYEVTSVATTTT